jgi:hypothetical protein
MVIMRQAIRQCCPVLYSSNANDGNHLLTPIPAYCIIRRVHKDNIKNMGVLSLINSPITTRTRVPNLPFASSPRFHN